MRYFITGGAGFIGSHLADALIARGDEVVALDNLSTGSLENVRHLQGHPRFELVIGSVLNSALVRTLMQRCDVVFHLAAAVGVKWVMEHPLLSIETNLKGSSIVLEEADRLRRRTILASTSEVYGKNGHGPLQEDADRVMGSTCITRWLYATTKACDEFLALAYHREKGLPITITRFFNTVGPRQTGQFGMVIPRFVGQALADEPITVYGDGKQMRCFTDVFDAVGCLLALAESTSAIGLVVNIGNPSEVSMENLARRVVQMTRSRSRIVYVPYEEAYGRGFEDMRRRVPDVTRLREIVGTVPDTPLEVTLQRIIGHFAERSEYSEPQVLPSLAHAGLAAPL